MATPQSFNDFIKRKGLNTSTKNQSERAHSRYEDYLRNFRVSDAVDVARNVYNSVSGRTNRGLAVAGGKQYQHPVPKGRTGAKPKQNMTSNQGLYLDQAAAQDMIQKYFMSLSDPWARIAAKQPTIAEYPSTCTDVRVVLEARTDSAGNFMLIVSDDLDRFIADSWTLRGTGNKPTIIQGSSGKWGIRAPADPTDVNDPVTLTMWQGAPDKEGMKDLFSSFRTVSMGITMKYIAELVQAKGRIVAFLAHPNEELPAQRSISDLTLDAGWSFQSMLERESALTYAPIDGVTLLWRPFGSDVSEFRPSHMVRNTGSSAMINGGALTASARGDGYAMRILAELGNIGAFADNPETFTGGKWSRTLDKMLASDSPALVIAGSGLQPNTEVFNIELVWNLECIADERTLDFETPLQPVVAQNTESMLPMVYRTLAGAPASAAGYRPDSSAPVDSIASDAAESSGITFGDIMDGVSTAVDIGTALAALFV